MTCFNVAFGYMNDLPQTWLGDPTALSCKRYARISKTLYGFSPAHIPTPIKYTLCRPLWCMDMFLGEEHHSHVESFSVDTFVTRGVEHLKISNMLYSQWGEHNNYQRLQAFISNWITEERAFVLQLRIYGVLIDAWTIQGKLTDLVSCHNASVVKFTIVPKSISRKPDTGSYKFIRADNLVTDVSTGASISCATPVEAMKKEKMCNENFRLFYLNLSRKQ